MVENSSSDNRFCCEHMRKQVYDNVIIYNDSINEFSILVKSDGKLDVIQTIDFCPWSGDKLPESQRDRWFDELEAKGIDPLNDEIPSDYQSAEWRAGM